VVAADPVEPDAGAIDAVNATVRTVRAAALPTALLALSDRARTSGGLDTDPLYQRAPGEAQRERCAISW